MELKKKTSGEYGKSSKSTQILHNISAQEFKKEVLQINNIQAPQQQSKNLSMISQANSQIKLKQPKKLQPNADISLILPLSQVSYSCLPFFSKK